MDPKTLGCVMVWKYPDKIATPWEKKCFMTRQLDVGFKPCELVLRCHTIQVSENRPKKKASSSHMS